MSSNGCATEVAELARTNALPRKPPGELHDEVEDVRGRLRIMGRRVVSPS